MSDAVKAGIAAEKRGSKIAPTPFAYKRAFHRSGPTAVGEALVSRHNHRMLRLAQRSAVHIADVMPVLAVVPVLDMCLRMGGAQFQAQTDVSPSTDSQTWSNHLRACVDELVQVSRLLLASQFVGAALVARTMLERTTANRSVTFGVDRLPDEDSVSWMSKVWALDEEEVNGAGEIWSGLSEMLHGQGAVVAVAKWESDGLEVGPPPEAAELRRLVVAAQALAFGNSGG